MCLVYHQVSIKCIQPHPSNRSGLGLNLRLGLVVVSGLELRLGLERYLWLGSCFLHQYIGGMPVEIFGFVYCDMLGKSFISIQN